MIGNSVFLKEGMYKDGVQMFVSSLKQSKYSRYKRDVTWDPGLTLYSSTDLTTVEKISRLKQ